MIVISFTRYRIKNRERYLARARHGYLKQFGQDQLDGLAVEPVQKRMPAYVPYTINVHTFVNDIYKKALERPDSSSGMYSDVSCYRLQVPGGGHRRSSRRRHRNDGSDTEGRFRDDFRFGSSSTHTPAHSSSRERSKPASSKAVVLKFSKKR